MDVFGTRGTRGTRGTGWAVGSSCPLSFVGALVIVVLCQGWDVNGQLDVHQVCRSNDTTECACAYANLTINDALLTKCFSDYVCKYDTEENVFCSAHGTCDFENAICDCDDDWGGDDCSKEYEIFQVNGVIKYGLIVLGTIIAISCLLLMAWVYVYRSVSDVKAMSVTFTQLTLLGCFFVCLHSVVVGAGFNEVNCVVLEWFVFFGVSLLIGCALLKAYRIASIFSSESFSPSDLTDKVLLRYLCIVLVIDIVLLIMYTAFNYVEGGSYDRPVTHTSNDGDIEYLIERRCSSATLTSISYYLLVAWQAILLFFVLKYGNRTSSASNIFKETTCIYLASNIGAIFFITFGIFLLFTTNYQFQIAVRGFGSLAVVVISLCLLFWPKFQSVYAPPTVDEDGLTESERALSKQYEVNLKDRTGKELLLVLDNLVSELASRVDMKMLRLEFNSIDIHKITKLMEKLVELSPDARMTPVNSSSDIHNLETNIHDQTKSPSPYATDFQNGKAKDAGNGNAGNGNAGNADNPTKSLTGDQ